jgi:HYDIN/CFA65/VesB family protein
MRRNSSIHPHGRMFAIALATIVAAFTLVSPAKAEIVYHSANIGINDGTYNLDLNGDGVTDFTIMSTWRSGSCGVLCKYSEISLGETPASGNGAVVGPLKRGDEIGPNQAFDGNSGLMSEYASSYRCTFLGCYWSHGSGGPWLGKKGYLGLSFQVNGQTYYGWALLKCPGGTYGGGQGTLLGYAYETIPGRAILAGETSYIWFTPALLNFGTVTLGTTASGSATLTNLGPTTVAITNAKLTGLNSADFAGANGNPPCGDSVAAGATCTLTFTFTPSVAGKERANYLVYDNTGGSPQKLTLVGTGQ